MSTTESSSTTTVDEAAVEEFMGRVLVDVAGSMATRFATIGDVLGLWKDLAAGGPATSSELATRTGLDERYVREWLAGCHAASYVEHDAASGRFTLPAHAVPVLAEEGGTHFFGGSLQMISGMAEVQGQVLDAFRTGGGVPQSAMPHAVFEGIARFTNAWFDHALVPAWMPLLPEIEAALVAGCDVADVGTGAGRALVALAEAYPKSRFVGYEVSPEQVELAQAGLEAAGVTDRARVELVDGSSPLPDQFDVITTFDVIHDAVDPAGLLETIRAALRPGGRYLCLDMHASHELADNVGPIHTLMYGCSIHYCMTTSLAHGGTGLGTCGFNPHVAEEMCRAAGFAGFRIVEIDDPFNLLYEVTVTET